MIQSIGSHGKRSVRCSSAKQSPKASITQCFIKSILVRDYSVRPFCAVRLAYCMHGVVHPPSSRDRHCLVRADRAFRHSVITLSVTPHFFSASLISVCGDNFQIAYKRVCLYVLSISCIQKACMLHDFNSVAAFPIDSFHRFSGQIIQRFHRNNGISKPMFKQCIFYLQNSSHLE